MSHARYIIVKYYDQKKELTYIFEVFYFKIFQKSHES